MPTDASGLARRYRSMRDLTPFELTPLIGPGATLEQLRSAAGGLAGGWALECLTDDVWTAVGWTGTEDRAREWVELGGDPDCTPEP